MKHPGSRRRSPPPWHPKAFDPGRDLGYVAGVRGLLDYAVRHLPVLLAGGPVAVGGLGALGGGLRDLDFAARRLAEALRPLARPGTSRPPRGRRRGGGIGPASPGKPESVVVEEAPDGPENKHGTYAVIYVLSRPATVTVKSGLVYPLPAGWYAYVGTMFGSGGVRARVAWHLDPTKDPQKNIDFLKPVARPVEVWWTDDEDRQECRWSAVMAASPEYHCPAPKFGATDCRICPAHLYFTGGPPNVYDFAPRLGRLVPGHAPVLRRRLGPDRPR